MDCGSCCHSCKRIVLGSCAFKIVTSTNDVTHRHHTFCAFSIIMRQAANSAPSILRGLHRRPIVCGPYRVIFSIRRYGIQTVSRVTLQKVEKAHQTDIKRTHSSSLTQCSQKQKQTCKITHCVSYTRKQSLAKIKDTKITRRRQCCLHYRYLRRHLDHLQHHLLFQQSQECLHQRHLLCPSS